MKRIIVIGVTGSGKSTFSKKLSNILGLKYIQLDELFWLPNWEMTPDDQFFKKIDEATKDSSWIIDGNYNRTNHIHWPKADTVIWIDLPLWLTFYQNLSRSFNRALFRKEIWEGTGNKESFSRMFSKDSIVRWLFKTYRPHKKRNEDRLKSIEYSHINFHRLRSRREISDFLLMVAKRSDT
ncbi:hypothetical protein HBN50_03380 [Halobacteriovorax sp. GB3]|uniref:hypothetical protein n=1 Tax=Halobacteriovorax sp. GB3 TaxID=2719615 RepID=UPI00235E4FCA|nr:hypothetical protein [Halobacteriovorax sp. GB3]MDD0852119.1 hypothetical protein [Halobacteriovorax sp. GB3]